nr:hypothetical protein [Corynebacterium glucuronolyticum]
MTQPGEEVFVSFPLRRVVIESRADDPSVIADTPDEVACGFVV